MDQLVQVAGALLILSPFAALQFGRMRADSRVYLILNLTGSAVLTVRRGRPRRAPRSFLT